MLWMDSVTFTSTLWRYDDSQCLEADLWIGPVALDWVPKGGWTPFKIWGVLECNGSFCMALSINLRNCDSKMRNRLGEIFVTVV